MPLATKNGSLIVKSGSIAENCNCCAGGWYCCRDVGASCEASEFIKSATVTVTTGADYVKEERSVNRGQSCAQRWNAKSIAIVPSSHYAGTFNLSRFSGTEWKYFYPADGAGCAASISLELRNIAGVAGYSFAWRLGLLYNSYIWQKNALSMPTETKTLSDMQCSPPARPSLLGCYTSPVEWFNKAQYSTNTNTGSFGLVVSGFFQDGNAPSCPGTQTKSYSGVFNSFGLEATNDSKSGTGTPIDIVSESGSAAYSMALTIQSD